MDIANFIESLLEDGYEMRVSDIGIYNTVTKQSIIGAKGATGCAGPAGCIVPGLPEMSSQPSPLYAPSPDPQFRLPSSNVNLYQLVIGAKDKSSYEKLMEIAAVYLERGETKTEPGITMSKLIGSPSYKKVLNPKYQRIVELILQENCRITEAVDAKLDEAEALGASIEWDYINYNTIPIPDVFYELTEDENTYKSILSIRFPESSVIYEKLKDKLKFP